MDAGEVNARVDALQAQVNEQLDKVQEAGTAIKAALEEFAASVKEATG